MARLAVALLSTVLLFGSVGALGGDSATTVFRVSGMTCGMCARAIERALESVPGVHSVDIDHDSGRVEILAPSTIDPKTLEGAIEGAGAYQAELEPAEG